MNRLARANRFSRQLGTPVRYDFVGVGIRAGAGTGLKNIERKMFIQFPLDHFFRRLDDQGAASGVEQPKIVVRLRGRPFDQTEGADEWATEAVTADRKI